MSSRPQFSPHKVIDAVSMAASITSEVTIIQKLSMISYDIAWTGTSPVGSITVEVSNSYVKDASGVVSVAGNWTTLPVSAMSVSGNSGNGFLDIDAISAYAIRLVYTRTSGTGSLTVIINGKVA